MNNSKFNYRLPYSFFKLKPKYLETRNFVKSRSYMVNKKEVKVMQLD